MKIVVVIVGSGNTNCVLIMTLFNGIRISFGMLGGLFVFVYLRIDASWSSRIPNVGVQVQVAGRSVWKAVSPLWIITAV